MYCSKLNSLWIKSEGIDDVAGASLCWVMRGRCEPCPLGPAPNCCCVSGAFISAVRGGAMRRDVRDDG